MTKKKKEGLKASLISSREMKENRLGCMLSPISWPEAYFCYYNLQYTHPSFLSSPAMINGNVITMSGPRNTKFAKTETI